MDSFLDYIDVITSVSAVIVIGLNILQNKRNSTITKNSSLISLHESFLKPSRQTIYKELRNSRSIETWTDLDDYLELFELCYILIKDKSLSLFDFKKLYSYRLFFLINNLDIYFYRFILDSKRWNNLYKLYILVFPDFKQHFIKIKNNAAIIEQKIGNYFSADIEKMFEKIGEEKSNEILKDWNFLQNELKNHF